MCFQSPTSLNCIAVINLGLTDKQLKFPRIIPVVLLWDHSYDFTQETINQEGSGAQQIKKGCQGTEGCCSYVRVK
jgi:hypothetical protein